MIVFLLLFERLVTCSPALSISPWQGISSPHVENTNFCPGLMINVQRNFTVEELHIKCSSKCHTLIFVLKNPSILSSLLFLKGGTG